MHLGVARPAPDAVGRRRALHEQVALHGGPVGDRLVEVDPDRHADADGLPVERADGGRGHRVGGDGGEGARRLDRCVVGTLGAGRQRVGGAEVQLGLRRPQVDRGVVRGVRDAAGDGGAGLVGQRDLVELAVGDGDLQRDDGETSALPSATLRDTSAGPAASDDDGAEESDPADHPGPRRPGTQPAGAGPRPCHRSCPSHRADSSLRPPRVPSPAPPSQGPTRMWNENVAAVAASRRAARRHLLRRWYRSPSLPGATGRHAPLAQLAEQLTLNQRVRGSSP